MKIIFLSTPVGYLGSGRGGGVELTLNSLLHGFINQGHSVKVVAPEFSSLVNGCEKAEIYCVKGEEQDSWQHQDFYAPIIIPNNALISSMLDEALYLAENADVIINFSYDWLPIWLTLHSPKPIAHLISMGAESFAVKNVIEKVHKKYPNNFAFHSYTQASDYSFVKNPIVVGNGFDLNNYDFKDVENGPLAWVGRVAPEKGLEDAAYVANKIGEQLFVWGHIQDKVYAENIEASFPSGLIQWKGFVKTEELQKELGLCRALINTPKWNEAYGNVIVEAMACGVPVVAYERGGPKEIIQHGETGFLVKPNEKEKLLNYLKNINTIKRENCRRWVENNASSDIFANKVFSWLKKLIN